jgi:hypothetical protein
MVGPRGRARRRRDRSAAGGSILPRRIFADAPTLRFDVKVLAFRIADGLGDQAGDLSVVVRDDLWRSSGKQNGRIKSGPILLFGPPKRPRSLWIVAELVEVGVEVPNVYRVHDPVHVEIQPCIVIRRSRDRIESRRPLPDIQRVRNPVVSDVQRPVIGRLVVRRLELDRQWWRPHDQSQTRSNIALQQ